MTDALVIVLLIVQFVVLWQACRRQPINVYVYLDEEDKAQSPPTRMEGDEWKDGKPEEE